MVLTVVLVVGNGKDSVPWFDEPEFAAAQDAELLENLEFLAWLEEEGGAG